MRKGELEGDIEKGAISIDQLLELVRDLNPPEKFLVVVTFISALAHGIIKIPIFGEFTRQDSHRDRSSQKHADIVF